MTEKETNLLVEESKKRFQQILEYTTFLDGNLVDEDSNDGEMSVDGGSELTDPQQDPVGQEEATVQQPTDGQIPNGLNPTEKNSIEQVQGTEDLSQEDFDGAVGSDDDVVDITELTDAQEETTKKVNKLGFNLDKAFKSLQDFEELINSTNDKISELQKEFEKRNPNQEERLSARRAVSYPFNQSPEDYWKVKEETSNYSLDDDENGEKQEQYTITNKDVLDNNWKGIADSMDDDRLYHQSIGNTLPF